MHSRAEDLVEKIARLPADRIEELDDFVEFLLQRERDAELTRVSSVLGANSLAEVWDNDEDPVYDSL
jgi:hypothetical protein